MTAPTPITVQELSGKYPASMDALTWAACDAVNGNSYASTGRELVLVHNTNASSTAHILTLHTSPDPYGRGGSGLGDVAQSVAAAAYAMAFLGTAGWRQSGNVVNLTGADAELFLAVVRLPTGT